MASEIINVYRLCKPDDIGFTFNINEVRLDRIRRKDSYVHNVDELKANLKHIYEQYIDQESVYCVNLSAHTRRELQQSYERYFGDDSQRKPNGDDENIMVEIQMHEIKKRISISRTTSPSQSGNNEITSDLIKSYVIIFDQALDEIIGLIGTDSLSRFHQSIAYRNMIQSQATN